jgi:hypothetical protein
VVDFVIALKTRQPVPTTPQCLAAIEAEFGIKVLRRSLERAYSRR